MTDSDSAINGRCPSLTDDDVHSPAAWCRDLEAAGWVEREITIWEAPDGALYRGPYGAWRELQKANVGK